MSRLFLQIVAVLALVLAGCLGEDVGPGYVSSWASVDSVKVVSARVPTVLFLVVGSKPTPCHEVVDPAITQDAKHHRVIIEVSSRVPKDRLCIQVLSSYEKLLEVPVSEPGEWECVFRGSPSGEELVITVTVTR